MEEKNTKLQGFTVSMALMDCIPVVLFSASAAVLASRFESTLFLIGAITVIAAGALKVLWKFVLALAGKDIPFLNRQMRYLMPAGFVLMILGLLVNRNAWSLHSVIRHMLSMPSLLFFVLTAVCMTLMTWFAKHLDGRDARSNWIEQGTNCLGQLFFLLGILF